METSVITQPPDTDIGSSFFNQELPSLIQKIKNDCSWKNGDLKSMVILNDYHRQVVLTAMHSQTEIESDHTGDWINFHVLEGSMKIKVRKESTIVQSGQKYTLFNKAKYTLESMEETIFLMIISPTNSTTHF